MSKRTTNRSRTVHRKTPSAQKPEEKEAAPYSVKMEQWLHKPVDGEGSFTLHWAKWEGEEAGYYHLVLVSPAGRHFHSMALFRVEAGASLLDRAQNHYAVDFDRTAPQWPYLFFPVRLYVAEPCLGSKELRFLPVS